MTSEGYALPQSGYPQLYGRLPGNNSSNEEYEYSNIDDENLCFIRFYKTQHYQDPTPYSFGGIRKPRTYLQERSIKVFGKCCWRVFT